MKISVLFIEYGRCVSTKNNLREKLEFLFSHQNVYDKKDVTMAYQIIYDILFFIQGSKQYVKDKLEYRKMAAAWCCLTLSTPDILYSSCLVRC